MQWLQDIIPGFYSRRFYYDLAHDRKGFGLGYIVILTIISTLCLPLYLWQTYPAMHPVVEEVPALADTLPAITFEGGKISIDKPVPFRVNLGSGSDNMWVIVDTNYVIVDTNTLAKVLRESNTVLLLTSDKLMIMKDAAGTLELDDLKSYPPFSISHDKWRTLGKIIDKRGLTLYTIALVVVTFAAIFLYNFLMSVVTGGVAKILSWVLRASFDFIAAMRLAAMMRIPVTVITAVPALMGAPLSDGAAWLVWWGYLIFIVLSCREKVYSKS